MESSEGKFYDASDITGRKKSLKRVKIERDAINTYEPLRCHPYITSFPVELLLEIFSYLTFEDLYTLRKVCKLFYEVVGNPSIWRIYKVQGNETHTMHVISELKRMPLLKKFTIENRADSDDILRQLSLTNKYLQELCIMNCTGSTAKLYLKSLYLTRILERCRRLHTINIQGTRFRGLKFYKLLANMGLRLRTARAPATSLQFRTFANHARHISERGRQTMAFMCFGGQSWVPLYYSMRDCGGSTSVVVNYNHFIRDFTSVDVMPEACVKGKS